MLTWRNTKGGTANIAPAKLRCGISYPRRLRVRSKRSTRTRTSSSCCGILSSCCTRCFYMFRYDGNEHLESFEEALAAEDLRRVGQMTTRQTYFAQGLVY